MLTYLVGGVVLVFVASQLIPEFDVWDQKHYTVLVFLLGATLVLTLTRVSQSIYHGRQARQLGCKPAFRRYHRLPGGVDFIYRIFQADARGQVPEEFVAIQKAIGRTTYRQFVLGKQNFVTSDPKNLQAMLATQFNDFAIGPNRRNNFFPLLGNGIFTSDGPQWEHSRALLRPQFTREQVGHLELEETHLQLLLKHIITDETGWTGEVNLQPLFFRLTFDSATEFLFGQSANSQVAALEPSNPEKRHAADDGVLDWNFASEAFDSAMLDLGRRARFNELYWLYSPSSFFKHCKDVHKFANHYVDLALNPNTTVNDSKMEMGEHKRYVFLTELAKVTQDRDELRSQLLNILLAGRDTTAGLLGWTFWLLARHPQVFEKLRKAVLDDFGTFDAPRNFSFASLKSCTYLQHTMNEVLRLFPSVPLNSRRAIKNTTLPVGGGIDGQSPLYIRKGTDVNYSVHIMHHRQDLWGPDADDFKPERWVGRKTKWEYLPFNAGPRICLGQQFALTEAGYVLARLMQKFDKIDNLDPSNVIKHQYGVTTAPHSIRVRLHLAK